MPRIVAATLVSLSLFLSVPASAQDQAAKIKELLQRGDQVYKKRWTQKAAWEAIYYYQEALKLDANNFDTLWRLARSHYSLSDTIRSKARKKDLGWKGYEFGKKAAKLRPKRVEGWFYGVICLGEYSLGIGILTALRQGIEGKFRGMLDKAIAINPGFDYAGPLRAYGRFYHKLPWPKRDYKKAEQYLLHSRRLAPTKIRTFLYLAELYADDGRKGDAQAQLRTCVGLKPGKEDPPDGSRYLRLCKKLLKKLEAE